MRVDDKVRFEAGKKITWIGIIVNALLIICKFLAGFLGHSQGLIADAVHSVSDFVTDAVVLVGLRIGHKAPDADHHFGHARIETVASSVVGIVLLIVAVLLGYNAAKDIYYHNESHPTWLAVAGAVLSIMVKEVLYRYTVRVGRRIKSPAVMANAWHHRSDALSSVCVLIGLIGAQINPGWHILDAYAALLVCFFIAKVGMDILWIAVREIADTAPGPEVVEKIMSCARNVPNVIEAHDLKVRSLGGRYEMSVHVVVDPNLTVSEGHNTAKQVELCIIDELGDVGEVVVHIDPADSGEGKFRPNSEEDQ